MSVIRINKTKDFTVMSNYHFRDRSLSLKAKGLLSQMLSLPETWDYTIAGLVAINKENETAINNTLKELKERGYLAVTKLMPNETTSGRIEYIYDIYEQPQEKQELKKQGVENQGVVFQVVENQGQYNTNKSITNISSKKDKKKDSYDSIIQTYTKNEELQNTLFEFIKMRKLIKKPLTDRALFLLLKKLNDISEDEETQIKILEQSILNNWQSVYPLKIDGNKVGTNGIKLSEERDTSLDDIF